MSSEQMQGAIKDLQETMVVMAHIDKMRSVKFGPSGVQSDRLRQRIEKNLAEITEKLNRLIDPQ